jgi:two-component system response regulator YesN
VVITDMRMPIMDGVELAKRCHAEFPHIKVVVLSGYSDFEYVKNSMKQGVKDYLLKPVAPDELVETLRKIRKEVEEEKRKKVEIAQMNRLVHSHLQEVQEQYILHLAKEERLQLSIVRERLQQLQLEELADENKKVQFLTVEIREVHGQIRLEELRIPFQLLCKEIAQEQAGTYVFTDPSYTNMVQFLQLNPASTSELVERIQQSVKTLLKLETVIGIGTVVNGLTEFRTGYISSLLAWSQSQLGSKSQIMDQNAASK